MKSSFVPITHNSTYDLDICLLGERAQLHHNNTNIFLLWTKKEFSDFKLNLPEGVNKSIKKLKKTRIWLVVV